MRRYDRFMAAHPYLAFGLAMAGLLSLVIGAAGTPSNIESWGKFFTWLGRGGARWGLAVVGLAMVAAIAIPFFAERRKKKNPPPAKVKAARRKEPGKYDYLKVKLRQDKLAERRLERLKIDVQDELVAIIDQGNTLNPNALAESELGPFRYWQQKTARFLEWVFGQMERQKFLEAYKPPPTDHAGLIAQRIRRLADLRDRPDTWRLDVDRWGLRLAMEYRRFPTAADRIVLAAPGGAPQLPTRETREEIAKDIRELVKAMEATLVECKQEEASSIAFAERRGLGPGTHDLSQGRLRELATLQARRTNKLTWQNKHGSEARKLFREACEWGVAMRSDRDSYVDPEPSKLPDTPEAFSRLADRLIDFDLTDELGARHRQSPRSSSARMKVGTTA